uniref:Thiol:disulfide interchange protein n=1 Tax=Digenea simplex TaxID=945030 RepID=A0A1Z1MTP8_DIGSM|nr:thiol:disulfide interchange protein [Digenea simplex]ARW69458.1 thiol:disulfide interchange protein [Digenea simplex]
MLYIYRLLDKYEIITYSLYQSLYSLLFSSSNFTNFFSICLFFSLGLITILTPCFISIIPLVLSYANYTNQQKFNKILFLCGLLNSFFLMLILSNFFSFYIFFDKISILSSLFLIVIALNLMQILDFSLLSNFFYQIIPNYLKFGFNASSYIIGSFIGLSSIPCNSSIILFVTFWLTNLNNCISFLLYLSIYLLGCLLPLLFLLNFKMSYSNIRILSSTSSLIFPFSGSFLLIFSLLSLLRLTFL